MPFGLFKFHPTISANLKNLGYQIPTPIQQQSIPSILEGRDVMGIAQTGTGKTAAFVLPMLQQLHESRKKAAPLVRALVIVPTRELAQQIHEVVCQLSLSLGLRSLPIYGGACMKTQLTALRRGVDIVVACPGRLLDHVKQRTIDLSHVHFLVLDEADQMFDLGFLPSIREILKYLPSKRQSALFSATMPKDVRRLAEDILHQPVVAQISNTVPSASVVHALYPVAHHLKTELLIEMLQMQAMPSVLVFTRTRHAATRLAVELSDLGYKTASLQGDLSQRKRQSALDRFRSGKIQILIATEIAARGIHVDGISHVINFDMPETVEAYTHRVGRTGRANQSGHAFTIVTPQDMSRVRTLERVLGFKLEQKQVPGFDSQFTSGSTSPKQRNNTKRSFRQTPSAGDRKPNRRDDKKVFTRRGDSEARGRASVGDKPRRYGDKKVFARREDSEVQAGVDTAVDRPSRHRDKKTSTYGADSEVRRRTSAGDTPRRHGDKKVFVRREDSEARGGVVAGDRPSRPRNKKSFSKDSKDSRRSSSAP